MHEKTNKYMGTINLNIPIPISRRIEYTYQSNQQCTDTYFRGRPSRSVGAQTKTHVHIYVDMSIYMYLWCGCAKVYSPESVETYTETDADTEACICKEIFLGDLSSHPQEGAGLLRYRALRSEVLHGTGSEGPQQEVYGETNEVDEAITSICLSIQAHARNIHTPGISSARTHIWQKVFLHQRILTDEHKYTHIYT